MDCEGSNAMLMAGNCHAAKAAMLAPNYSWIAPFPAGWLCYLSSLDPSSTEAGREER